MCKYLKRTMSNTLDFVSTDDLNWHTHISSKRKQLGISLAKMYWLLGRKSKLSINNKLLIYKVIFKPIWTYGIQLWGKTSKSNIEILERFQSKVLETNSGCPLVRKKIPSLVMTFKYQQSKKKSADSALITMLASVYTPMNSSPASILAPRPPCQILATCINCSSCL
jgi:hypothetical protein